MITLLKTITFGALNLNLNECDPTEGTQHKFFEFPNWWEYIHTGHFDGLGNCTPEVEFPSGIWLIALALVDMLLYLAGLVAVVFIIIAGIQYITAGGSPEKAAAARQRIYHSLIGLGAVLVAVAFVTFIGSKLGP